MLPPPASGPTSLGGQAAAFSHRRARPWTGAPRRLPSKKAGLPLPVSAALAAWSREGLRGINKASRLACCLLPGPPRQALLPLTCPSLETGKALTVSPREGAPEWPSRVGQPFSSSGVCTISSLVQTCSILGPIQKHSDSGQVGIQRVAVASPGL